MKTKIKSPFKVIVLLLLLFLIFLYFLLRPYDYEKKYVINAYSIKESYSKEDKEYSFIVEYNDINYPFIIKSNYLKDKKLIKEVEQYEKDSAICLLPKSDKLEFYPICSVENNLVVYNLINTDENFYKYSDIVTNEFEFNKVKVNYLNNKSYLLFNYKGFYYINNNKKDNIKLFSKDVYALDLIFQHNNTLVIPNYDDEHYFKKIYLLEINSGKLKEIMLDNAISYDSIFLGSYKNSVYILDKKEEKEYKIDIKKKKIEETDFQIIENNKLVKKTFKEIIYNNYSNEKNSNYKYEIVDDLLYLNLFDNKIKISNKKVDTIIKNDNDTVYYLVKDNLYMYNNIYGEILLMNNFEWNFNKNNMIYISK